MRIPPAVRFVGAWVGLVLSTTAPGRAQTPRSVSGTVSDSASAVPLANVLVTIAEPGGERVGSDISGPGGAFRIEGISPGEYVVRASLPGWEALPQPALTVAPNRTATISIVMVQQAHRLNPLTVSVSRTGEKVLEAPAAVATVDLEEVKGRPALTTVEHVRDQTAVDYMKTGLQGSYVVVRGFNNVFSGATLTMTDNRITRLPSLRANISYFDPVNSLDLDHAEVVLGPGSALYGPNVEQGIIHTFTRSPIDDPGISVSVTGGLREQPAVPEQRLESSVAGVSLFESRAAYRASGALGFKLSGQYFAATDFPYKDPDEQGPHQAARACLDGGFRIEDENCQQFAQGLDLGSPAAGQELEQRVVNVAGGRDNDLRRWTLDGRVDWRPGPRTQVVVAGGRAMAVKSVELTGLGAGQILDWAYDYAQARLHWNDLFAQVYTNRNENDGSYLLRTGATLVDRSHLFVAQVQNVSGIDDENRLVYGVDFLRTVPVTDSTINGANEADDDVNEVGGYLQWDSALSRQLGLVLAARVDKNSRLEKPVFSPRAAVVYHPRRDQSLRLTFNRAFSTPNSISLFLDISGATAPIDGLPFNYDVRAQGGGDTGFTFRREAGIPMHLSPFAPLIDKSAREFIPTTTSDLWEEGVSLAQFLAREGELPPELAQLLSELPPPSDSQVPVSARYLDLDSREFRPYPGGLAGVEDLPPLEPGVTNTLELGYKGLLKERLLVGASGWYSHVSNRISALRVISPNVFLDDASLNSYLSEQFLPLVGTAFPDEETARATAAEVAGVLGQIPLGVVAPEQAGGTLAPIVMTDRNLGSFDLFGVDVSLAWYLTDGWRVEGNVSWVSDDVFTAGTGRDAEIYALNSSSLKGALAVSYGDPASGFHATVLGRAIRGFPASSGVYSGEVDSYANADLDVGYRFPKSGLWLQLGVQNVLGTGYRTFPGAATLGRTTLLRVRYDTPRF